jgi:hypothetical protein
LRDDFEKKKNEQQEESEIQRNSNSSSRSTERPNSQSQNSQSHGSTTTENLQHIARGHDRNVHGNFNNSTMRTIASEGPRSTKVAGVTFFH